MGATISDSNKGNARYNLGLIITEYIIFAW